jgi:uncharacterized protein YybS (DUF2232 family)
VSSFSTSAVVESGKAVGLVVVTSLMVAFLPLASVVLLPLMPLPLAYLTIKRGPAVALAAAIAAGLLGGAFTGPANGVLTLLVAGLVGLCIGVALRSGWGFSRTLLASTGAASVALFGSAGLGWWLSGMSWDQLTKISDDSIVAASKMYASVGMSQASIDAAVTQVKTALQALPYLLPSIVAVGGLALACISLALVSAVFPRVGQTVSAQFSFARFRMHWSVAYGLILAFALMVLAPFLGEAQEAVRYAGVNLFIFFMSLFFVQGLALANWYARLRHLRPGMRAALYLAAVLGQFMLLLTSWAGLLDTWLDLRKRFAPPGSDSGAAPSTTLGGGSDHKES